MSEQRRGEALREQILWAAKLELLDRGYGGATMDQVAARAGTTKRSVYHHFPDKDALFRETMMFASRLFRENILPIDPNLDDVEALTRFCARLREQTTWGESVRLQQAVLAERTRFPDLITGLYDATLGESERRLGTELARRFRLEPYRARRLARMLIDVTVTGPRMDVLFGLTPPIDGPPTEGISPALPIDEVRAAVAVILRGEGLMGPIMAD